ncbi:MAG TPA: acyl carrier protein [Sedimenticola thiotaurini]|uniref:Acyl carrier protein n=1 Tax=Sedimenticola thiotaurini TaxID=1543721 RepID=A0A831W4Q9_9GAMM|nr:acyl carrier protein [Sedimenticola thiotaurini]
MSIEAEVIQVLEATLQLPKGQLRGDSALLGALPEFDSMAVVNVIGALEENFGIEFDDDEISAEIFESVETLVQFVEEKT